MKKDAEHIRKKKSPARRRGSKALPGLALFLVVCLSSLASWAAALWPAIESADMKGAAAAGAFTSPMRTLRNAISWP